MTTDDLVTEIHHWVRSTADWDAESPERAALVAALDRWFDEKLNEHMMAWFAEMKTSIRPARDLGGIKP
jgi:hypothetical protein